MFDEGAVEKSTCGEKQGPCVGTRSLEDAWVNKACVFILLAITRIKGVRYFSQGIYLAELETSKIKHWTTTCGKTLSFGYSWPGFRSRSPGGAPSCVPTPDPCSSGLFPQ